MNPNDPSITSWIPVDPSSDFPIQNLPYGSFSFGDTSPRIGVAIGDQILDLHAVQELGFLDHLHLEEGIFNQQFLNDFMALGKEKTNPVRERISWLLNDDNPELRDQKEWHEKVLTAMDQAIMHLPVRIGDYTDFYSSEQHAFNVGSMFRDPKNALMPNWKYIPVGYHGRASSIVVSGTPIHRPKGQQRPNDDEAPVFGPCKLLDFELEMGFVVNKPTTLGQSVSTDEAEDYIFGLCLFNDWSARDIQKWEYVPLGPFLAKNFASSLAPWIVTLEALEPFRTSGPLQDPPVLPYLAYRGEKHYDMDLEVYVQGEKTEAKQVCKSNLKYLYWNMVQQLAHHTISGCNLNTGDLMASGTISGPDPSAYGSMLEISWRGTKPVPMSDGSERKFILDGDTVVMKGYGIRNGIRIGFGEVSTKILPAHD